MRRMRFSKAVVATAWSLAAIVPAVLVVAAASLPRHAATDGAENPVRFDPSAYRPAEYVAAARALGRAADAAIRSQLGISAAEFLADGRAAADAAEVVDALRARGIGVVDARIDGTLLTVYVKNAADAVAVEAAGARAVVGAPERLDLPTTSRLASEPTGPLTGGSLDGGDGYYYTGQDFLDEPAAWLCSVGFNGHTAVGRPAYVTAGHCGDPFAFIAKPDGPVAALYDGRLGQENVGDDFAEFDKSTFTFGRGYDAGLVDITDDRTRTRPAVTTWAGGRSDRGRVSVIGQSAGIVGAYVCRSGITSGWQCGQIVQLDHDMAYAPGSVDKRGNPVWTHVNTIVTTACALPGDSGGPLLMGQFAVGITSMSDFWSCSARTIATNRARIDAGYRDDSDVTAKHAVFYSFAFPMLSSRGASVQRLLGRSWQLDVSVPRPVVTTLTASRIAGRVPKAVSGTTVVLTIDGRSRTAKVARNGAWSIRLAGLAPGAHRYSLVAKHGAWSSSAPVSGTLRLTGRATGAADQPARAGAVAPLKAATPTIAGAPRLGATLVAHTYGWRTGTNFSYQWYADGRRIRGATRPTFHVGSAQLGKRISVRVTGWIAGGGTATRTSHATAKATRR